MKPIQNTPQTPAASGDWRERIRRRAAEERLSSAPAGAAPASPGDRKPWRERIQARAAGEPSPGQPAAQPAPPPLPFAASDATRVALPHPEHIGAAHEPGDERSFFGRLRDAWVRGSASRSRANALTRLATGDTRENIPEGAPRYTPGPHFQYFPRYVPSEEDLVERAVEADERLRRTPEDERAASLGGVLTGNVPANVAVLQAESIGAAPDAVAGGLIGSLLGPAGTATGAALGGGHAEYHNAVGNLLIESGVDTSSPERLRETLGALSPQERDTIIERAAKRAVAMGAVEGAIGAVTGGVARVPVASAAARTGRTAGGVAIETAGEGLGELAGSLAAGQDVSADDIALEMLAGGSASVATTAGAEISTRVAQRSAETEGTPAGGTPVEGASTEITHNGTVPATDDARVPVGPVTDEEIAQARAQRVADRAGATSNPEFSQPGKADTDATPVSTEPAPSAESPSRVPTPESRAEALEAMGLDLAAPLPAPQQPAAAEPEAPPAAPQQPQEAAPVQAMGLPAGPVPTERLRRKTRTLIAETFTSKGDLPAKAFDAFIQREGRVAAAMKSSEYALADFRRAAKEAYGTAIPAGAAAQIDDALKGTAPLDAIPEPMRAPVQAMRSQIDALSDQLVRSGAAEGDLALTIEANRGTYLTRSYKAHDDPAWAEKVPPEVRNRAKAFLRKENPGLGESEISGLIDSLLYDGKNSPARIAADHPGLAKDLTVTKRRAGIGPELRELLGEIRDPAVNYVRSVSHMARLAATHRFMQEVRAAGLGSFLRERPVVVDGVSYSAPIGGAGGRMDARMQPLAGLYATPEVAEALTRLDAEDAPTGTLYRTYLAALGFSKAAKTVYSPKTQIRNYLGNILFAVAQGHGRIRSHPEALRLIGGDLLDASGSGRGRAKQGEVKQSGRAKKQRRAFLTRLTRLGVLDESVRAGELEDVLRDAVLIAKDSTSFSENLVARMGRATAGAAQKLYQAGDNAWKIYAFLNERERYASALPDLTAAQIDEHAARIVRNTYPTYSLVPRQVKRLRRFPLTGTFVSFPAEVMRTSYHTLRLIGQEMGSDVPAVQAIGRRRLAGTLAAYAIPTAATSASLALLGLTRDDDEAARRFMAPWERGSEHVYFKSTPGGRVEYIDVGYLNPYGYLKEPLLAILRGDKADPGAALAEGARGLMEPFVSEEILTARLLDIARNQTKDGQAVYNPEDTGESLALDVLAHVWEGVEPGAMTDAQRVAEAWQDEQSGDEHASVRREAGSIVTGARVQTLRVERSLYFSARDALQSERLARRAYKAAEREAKKSPGSRFAEDAQERAYEHYQRRVLGLHAEILADVRAARRLEVSPDAIERALIEGGYGGERARGLVRGYGPPQDSTAPR